MPLSHTNNPVLHTELSQIHTHSTLYRTIKSQYLSKAERPTFKKIIEYYKYVEPNEDLLQEMNSLLDILDSYRKTETLKNEQKLQFVQDRMEKQHAELYYKQKIVQHLRVLLQERPLSAASDTEATDQIPALKIASPLNKFLERVKNVRWRNILRDIWANADNGNVTVSLVQRMETPRSVDSRVSSSTASSSVSSSYDNFSSNRRIFMTNDGDELDLEQVRHQLNVQFLMSATPEAQALLKKLQDAFVFEHQMLESDVDYIRQVLDDESEFNYKASHFILPSSQELSEIEQYLADMLEHKHLQDKMDLMSSVGKVSKMLTPRKQKLPPKKELAPLVTAEQTALKSHTSDSNFKLLMNKENLLDSIANDKPAAEEMPSLTRSKTPLGSTPTSSALPSTTSSNKYLHRVQSRLAGTTTGMKQTKELASFLSGNDSAGGTEQEAPKRKRPSTASRLRKTVLSNRMS